MRRFFATKMRGEYNVNPVMPATKADDLSLTMPKVADATTLSNSFHHHHHHHEHENNNNTIHHHGEFKICNRFTRDEEERKRNFAVLGHSDLRYDDANLTRSRGFDPRSHKIGRRKWPTTKVSGKSEANLINFCPVVDDRLDNFSRLKESAYRLFHLFGTPSKCNRRRLRRNRNLVPAVANCFESL